MYSDLSDSIAGMVRSEHANKPHPAAPDASIGAYTVGYDGYDQPLWQNSGGSLSYFGLTSNTAAR